MTVCDVGPRDGLQNEAKTLDPAVRAELCDRLAAAGLKRMEAASFVNPKLVPQMAGAEEVMAALHRKPGTVYAGLVLNEKGYDRALAAGVDEIHYAFSAADEFGRRNQNATTAEGLKTALALVARARSDRMPITVTVSVALVGRTARQGAAGHARTGRGLPVQELAEPGMVQDVRDAQTVHRASSRGSPTRARDPAPQADARARRRADRGGGGDRRETHLLSGNLGARVPGMAVAAAPGRRLRADRGDSPPVDRELCRPQGRRPEADPGGGAAAEGDGLDRHP